MKWYTRTTKYIPVAYHEALHAAAAILVGDGCEKIVLGERMCRAYLRTREQCFTASWRVIVAWLAPSLIHDLSDGDFLWLAGCRRGRRAYAMKWLNKNRRRILLQARKIEKEIKGEYGTLLFPSSRRDEYRWRPKK